MEIQLLRKQIDQIDREIVTLLNRRAAIALQIGNVKQKNGQSIQDTQRESAVIKAALATNQGPMPESAVRKIFEHIIAACRNLQKI